MANDQPPAYDERERERVDERKQVVFSFLFLGFLCLITFMGGSGDRGNGFQPGDAVKFFRLVIVGVITFGLVVNFIVNFCFWAKVCGNHPSPSPEGTDIIPVLFSALVAAFGLVNCLATYKVWFAIDIVAIVLFLPVVVYSLYRCIRLEVAHSSPAPKYEQLPPDAP